MTSETVSEYLKTAKRLEGKFPRLKKFRRRKTLKPHEKAEITRDANIKKVMALNVHQRPERFQHGYKFPSERTFTNAYYKRRAKEIARYSSDPDKYKEISKRGHRLTPGEKGVITKKARKLKFRANKFRLTPAQARRLPAHAKIGQGLNAIKLRNTPEDAKILRVKTGGNVDVLQSGRTWHYVLTGADPVALAEAAEMAFAKGATQVSFWTSHGRVGDAAGDMTEFLVQLNSNYMQYLAETQDAGLSTDWLLGIVWVSLRIKKRGN